MNLNRRVGASPARYVYESTLCTKGFWFWGQIFWHQNCHIFVFYWLTICCKNFWGRNFRHQNYYLLFFRWNMICWRMFLRCNFCTSKYNVLYKLKTIVIYFRLIWKFSMIRWKMLHVFYDLWEINITHNFFFKSDKTSLMVLLSMCFNDSSCVVAEFIHSLKAMITDVWPSFDSDQSVRPILLYL